MGILVAEIYGIRSALGNLTHLQHRHHEWYRGARSKWRSKPLNLFPRRDPRSEHIHQGALSSGGQNDSRLLSSGCRGCLTISREGKETIFLHSKRIDITHLCTH